MKDQAENCAASWTTSIVNEDSHVMDALTATVSERKPGFKGKLAARLRQWACRLDGQPSFTVSVEASYDLDDRAVERVRQLAFARFAREIADTLVRDHYIDVADADLARKLKARALAKKKAG